MWDVYDLVHYLCNFLPQADETSLLSTTKYINDMILHTGYRFTTKWYRTSISICGKIRSLINNLTANADDIAPCMDVLASVKNVLVTTKNLSINLSLARSLETLRLREIHGVLPLRNGLTKFTAGTYRSGDQIALPPSLIKYRALYSYNSCTQVTFPIGIRNIDVTGFSGTLFIRDLVDLDSVKMSIYGNLPRDFFPANVTQITITGSRNARSLLGVVWPPRLQTLVTYFIYNIDTRALPKTLTALVGRFDLLYPLPNIERLDVVSVSNDALLSFDPARAINFHVEKMPSGFMDFVKKTKMTGLAIPVCGDMTDMCSNIPVTVEGLMLNRGTEHDLPRKLPEVKKLGIFRCFHEHRMLVVPSSTEFISVTKTNLMSFIPNKVLKKVHIQNCSLGNIEDLPDCVEDVHVDYNQITEIKRYPRALKLINISHNPIVSLASFEKTRVKTIWAESLDKFTGQILMPSTTKNLYIGETKPSLIRRRDGKMPIVHHGAIRVTL